MTTHASSRRSSAMPASIMQSGSVRMPVHKPDVEMVADRMSRPAPHTFSRGDRLAVMSWGRNSYDLVTVAYYRRGEAVIVRDEWTGDTRSLSESELMFLAGQAAAHHGRGPETPGVGVIYPAAGGAHGITNTGICVVCCHNR